MKQGLLKKEEKYWVIFLVGILLTICLTSFWLITKNPDAFINLFTKILDPGPVGRFMRITGYDWPESANVISTGDDDWLFDWEYYIVFETDAEQLEKWLSSPPPWDIGEWSAGPTPYKVIGSSFGTKGLYVTRYDNGSEKYSGDEQLINLVTSPKVWFVAEERCCTEIEYHSGSLIIIDLESNMVWVASWDH